MFFHNAKATLKNLSAQTNCLWASHQLLSIPKKHHMMLLQADGAGTVFDPFCIAPLQAFSTVFSRRGFSLTHAQITGPMGLKKMEHIQHLLHKELALPWTKKYQKNPDEADAEMLLSEFTATLNNTIAAYSTPTPHMNVVTNFLKQHTILSALTSGYSRKTIDLILPNVRDVMNFHVSTAADEVKDGKRISMIIENMNRLNMPACDMKRVIFFTDASSDILNVRASKNNPWIIGVSGFSTHVGITSKDDLKLMAPADLLEKRASAKKLLLESGAHAVIHDMSEAPLAIVSASQALFQGQIPMNTDSLAIHQQGNDEQLDASITSPKMMH